MEDSTTAQAIKIIRESAEQHKQQVAVLQDTIKSYKKMIKDLSKYYEASQDALAREKQGHSDGWQKVQEIADHIEDEYDLANF